MRISGISTRSDKARGGQSGTAPVASEIATEYRFSLADVCAALAYYFGHPEANDIAIREDEEFIVEVPLIADAASDEQYIPAIDTETLVLRQ